MGEELRKSLADAEATAEALEVEEHAERLTFEEVRHFVTFLPTPALEELAKGPLPDLKPGDPGYADAKDCRVCNTLEPLGSSGPAYMLLTWHDRMGVALELISDLAEEEGDDAPITRKVADVIGALSYARCSVIYGCAQAELAGRTA